MKVAEKDTISGRLKKRRASMTDRRKKQIVQNWLSSFVVTAVVVVAVTVSNTSTKTDATFTQLDSIGTEIIYEVSLLELGDNVDPESLKVVAESQLGSKESKLSTGVNQGVFSSLSPNTEYTVSIVGSKGFGNFTIESRKVRTSDGSGGTLLNLSFREMSDQHMKYLDLSGTSKYIDNKNEYSSVYLEYQYFVDGVATGSIETLNVTSPTYPFYIEGLPYENGTIVISLFATLKTGGNILLKQSTLSSPFLINASGYIDTIEPYSLIVMSVVIVSATVDKPSSVTG